jgi:hypothetical protein
VLIRFHNFVLWFNLLDLPISRLDIRHYEVNRSTTPLNSISECPDGEIQAFYRLAPHSRTIAKWVSDVRIMHIANG